MLLIDFLLRGVVRYANISLCQPVHRIVCKILGMKRATLASLSTTFHAKSWFVRLFGSLDMNSVYFALIPSSGSLNNYSVPADLRGSAFVCWHMRCFSAQILPRISSSQATNSLSSCLGTFSSCLITRIKGSCVFYWVTTHSILSSLARISSLNFISVPFDAII